MKKKKILLKYVLNTCALFFISAMLSILPIYIMFVMATQDTNVLHHGNFFIPGDSLAQNFSTILDRRFIRMFLNSFYIGIVVSVLNVFISSMMGFIFAKYNFRYKELLYNIILIKIIIPTQAILMAFIILMIRFNLANTHFPLIIPPAFSVVGVFWMTEYIKTNISDQMLEAAKVDGCGLVKLYLNFILPNIKPGITFIFILAFIWSWNSYLIPLFLISNSDLFTVPLGITLLGNHLVTDYSARILAMLLGTLPVILVFIIGSKYFVQGNMFGGN